MSMSELVVYAFTFVFLLFNVDFCSILSNTETHKDTNFFLLTYNITS